MIIWKVSIHKGFFGDYKILTSEHGVYAFTKKKTAEWYRKKHMRGKGRILKLYGKKIDLIKCKKGHKDERVFRQAVVLEVNL